MRLTEWGCCELDHQDKKDKKRLVLHSSSTDAVQPG